MIACLRPLIGLSCLRGRGQPPRCGAPGVVHRHAYRLLVAAAAASVALPCVAMAFPAVAGLHCQQDSGVARSLFHLYRDAPLPRTDGALATRASVRDRSAGGPRGPVITVAACALLAAAIWLWLARRCRQRCGRDRSVPMNHCSDR